MQSEQQESLLETAASTITQPVRTLRAITARPCLAWALAITVVISLLSALAFAAQLEFAPAGLEPDAARISLPRIALLLSAAVLGPVFGLLGLAIWTSVMQISSRVLGGKGSYRGQFTGLAFANIPSVLGVPFQLLPMALGMAGGVLAGLVGLGTSAWVVVLSALAVRENHGFSTGRAVVALLAPLALLIALFIALGFLIALVALQRTGA